MIHMFTLGPRWLHSVTCASWLLFSSGDSDLLSNLTIQSNRASHEYLLEDLPVQSASDPRSSATFSSFTAFRVIMSTPENDHFGPGELLLPALPHRASQPHVLGS